MPVVSGATAWDDPAAGQTCILVVNEALCHGTKSDHSPINPNQIHSFGIDCWDDPFDASRPISIGPIEPDLVVPLSAISTKIQFVSRSPASNELSHCPHIQSTSKVDWNPTQVSLSESSSRQGKRPEDSMDNFPHSNDDNWMPEDSMDDFPHFDDCPRMIPTSGLRRVNSQVSRSECDSALEDIPSRRSCTSRDRHSKVSAEVLADGFAIGID